MPNRFSSGKYAIAECDRCAQRYMLSELKKLVIKTKQVNIKVCPECWEEDQPQLQIGMYPINDPQAVREPRRDVSYIASGTSGLQTSNSGNYTTQGVGYPEGGSRIIEWGWNPVGGPRLDDDGLTPNSLVLSINLGTISVTTT
jgi:hypothetical protein